MYINGLGMRNTEGVPAIDGSSGSQKNSKISNFDYNMQNAVEAWKSISKTGKNADSSYSGDREDFCCEQCYINSQIINRLMTQSLYMRSMPGSMNMLGLSAYGTGNSLLSAYGNTLGLLGGSIFSNIQI